MTTMTISRPLYLAILITFLLALSVQAAPNLINYQGLLNDSGGLVNGPVPMDFRIYDAENAGSMVWGETQAVTVSNGTYQVLLGSGPPIDSSPALDSSIFINSELWLEITVNGEVMSARQRLSSVPYALRAERAGNICFDGDYINCYSGPPATIGIGPCAGGARFCLQSGDGFEANCSGEILPSTEIFDSIDNDCDGLVDNNAVAECTLTNSCECSLNSDCDDFNSCTSDICNLQTGSCESTPDNGLSCSDGDACTVNDACQAGTCSGTPISCADGNSCTLDTCNSLTGSCENTPDNGATCDDGDSGTENDQCDGAGTCMGSDIDECSQGTDGCDINATCANSYGSYSCSCNSGYSGDGFSCTDSDECVNATNNCDENAICTNTLGSFVCACDVGFEGDGVTCTEAADIIPPGDVTGLSATVRFHQIVLNWTDPGDGDFDHVEITWTPGGAAVQTSAQGVGTYTATNLTGGALYTFLLNTSDSTGNLSTGVTIDETPLAHTDCVAGEYIHTEGTGTFDRICVACVAGTYSSSANASSCAAWTTCTVVEYEAVAGTSTSDRVCLPN